MAERPEQEQSGSPGPSPKSVRVRLIVFGTLSIPLVLASTFRPDWLYFLHFWALSLWTPIIALPFVSLRPRAIAKPASLCLLTWTCAVLLLREPGLGLFLPAAPKPTNALRVVVLNCAGGETAAIREALEVDADVWLLQETTGPTNMRATLDEIDPSLNLVADFDACIVAKAKLTEAQKAGNSSVGDFEWKGQSIRLVSLRLAPPTFRLDWWNPEAHRAYQDDMRSRRKQLKEILDGAGVETAKIGLVGGDFNSTNRHAFATMMPGWSEGDLAAGRGWPGTGTNDFPLARVDQLWASPSIRVMQAFVQKTRNSDHRMVIADLELTFQ